MHSPKVIERVLHLYETSDNYRAVAAQVRSLAHKGRSDPQIATELGVKMGIIRWLRELNSIPAGTSFRPKHDRKSDSTSRRALRYTSDCRLGKWDELFKTLIGRREFDCYVMKGARP